MCVDPAWVRLPTAHTQTALGEHLHVPSRKHGGDRGKQWPLHHSGAACSSTVRLCVGACGWVGGATAAPNQPVG